MKIKDLQKAVTNFNEVNGLELDPTLRALDISTEVGEIQKEIIIGSNYGKTPYQQTDNLKGEIGDALYSLISLAIESNLDINECLAMTLDKMEKRFSVMNK